MKHTLSVVITAYNERENLEATVEVVLGSLDSLFDEYEVIIVDDCSTDGTAEVADCLAARYPAIRVLHHAPNRGFAASYRHGVAEARMTHVGLVTGDNEMRPESVRAIFAAVGTADVVVPYQANQQDRPLVRRTLSRLFTWSVNRLFGLRLRYFQGPCIYPTAFAQGLPMSTQGFAFLTEMLLRTVRAGHSYAEVPMHIQPRRYGRSSALSFRNVATAAAIVARLYIELRLWGVIARRTRRA
jgi:glycosyltransferase involved in cell wall biosynthesis